MMVWCDGQRTEEYGREIVCLSPRHAVEDEGTELEEGRRDSRLGVYG
jgi:hypothetical protein